MMAAANRDQTDLLSAPGFFVRWFCTPGYVVYDSSETELVVTDGPGVAELLSDEERRELFLRGANADYAALREDEAVWREVVEEREELNGTMTDGLEADGW